MAEEKDENIQKQISQFIISPHSGGIQVSLIIFHKQKFSPFNIILRRISAINKGKWGRVEIVFIYT